jgi:adenylate cyclase
MWRGKLAAVRGELRLFSALVLLAFVVCHLTAHILLLVSLDTAEAGLDLLMSPWRTVAGTGLLVTALAIHYLNALWSIYIRRSLRLTLWEGLQLGLGLSIPPTIMLHVAGTRIAELAFDAVPGYNYVLLAQFAYMPWLGVLQAVGLLTVWVHASIGIHFWLRTKHWYPTWQPLFVTVGLLLPALSLAGFISGGNQVARAAADPAFVRAVIADANVDRDTAAGVYRLTGIGLAAHLALLILPFAGRGVRTLVDRRRRPPRLTHANGRTAIIRPGASVLETLRENRIPHAAVCGGRGRCTTCRVLVTQGLEALPEPGPVEAKALARIGATPGMRLACQIHPTADIAIRPLLPPDAMAADGRVRGGLEGSERPVTVMFVDLRASTTLAEARLPYDVLFILNHFHRAMNDALVATDGYYSQFTGDGLMALYGLHEADAAAGVRQALRGAREMRLRLEQLNTRLSAELTAPLRIGIGIHVGDAIVGAIGPPRSQIISAIGDLVNTCARLEGLTKDYDCALILSRSAAEAAGLALPEEELHDVAVKGRVGKVQFYALKEVPAVAS